MAAKIFAFLALIALSVSAATAVLIPQCSIAATAATISQFLSPYTDVAYEHPIVQSCRLQQALAASILPSSAMFLPQQPALLQQQSLAQLSVQSIRTSRFSQLALANPAAYLQQQTHLPFNQLAMANPAAYLQQQQLLPFNQLATVNPAVYLQQQQLLSFNQLAAVNPAAILQQQVNPLAVTNVAAYWQQQQQLVNQLALTSPATFWQQPIIGSTLF